MAKAQGVVVLGALEFSFTPDADKHDTKGKKYAFRASIRGKVFKSRYVPLKELAEQKGYFSGVTQEDKVSFSLRSRSALGSHTIGEAAFMVPTPDKGTFRMNLEIHKKEKVTAAVTIEIGYFPHGISEKSSFSQMPIVSVDGKKHRDKENGDGEEDGNDDLSDQGSDGDENSCSLDCDSTATSSLPSFASKPSADLTSDAGGESKRGIIHKILKSSSKHSEKYATFLKRFGYSSEEALYTEYHVAFLKKQKQSVVSIPGVLYRSTNFLSFYSNNFNQETIEKIKIENLIGVSLIESSLNEQIIRFDLGSGKDFQFSAAMEENMFVSLLEEWEKNKLHPGNHLPLTITNIDISQAEFINRQGDSVLEEDPPSGSRCWQIVDASLGGFSVDHFLNSIVLGPDFEKVYHAKRGDGDLYVSPWVEESMNGDFSIFSRELTYQSKVKLKLPGVPTHCSIHEKQYYYQKENGALHFEVVSSSSEIPGCDSFRTETIWVASPEEGGIHLTGRMVCRFLKRTHLMGQITSAFYQIGQYTYKIWCETVMEFLQEVSFRHDEDDFLSKEKKEEKVLEDKGKGKEVQKTGELSNSIPPENGGRRGSLPLVGDGLDEGRGEDLPPIIDINEPVEPYLQSNLTELGNCKFADTTIQVVFEKIFSDKSDVVGNLHKRRKDWDTVTTDWSGEGRIKTRVTDFKFNIVSKIPKMPTEGAAQEKQRYYYLGDQLFVEAKAVTFGVPYCDYFETETKYVISPEGNGVTMQISSGLYFMKKTWLQGKIEADTMAVQRENTNIFLEFSEAAFSGEGSGGERGAGGAADLQQDYGVVVPMESSGFLEQKLKEVGSVTLPGVTVEEMFTKFWSDIPASIAVQEEFHRRKQEIEFKMGKWERDEKYGNLKEMTYKTPCKVRMPGVPAYAPVTEKVRFSITGNWLELENLVQTTGVPYAEYFLAEQRWKIVAEGGGVVVSVYGGVRFLKKTWLQGKIEGETIKAMKETVALWIQQAQNEVLGEGGGKGSAEGGGKGEDEVAIQARGEIEAVGGGGGGDFFDWKGALLAVLLFLYILLFIRFSMLVTRVEELEEALMSTSSDSCSFSESVVDDLSTDLNETIIE